MKQIFQLLAKLEVCLIKIIFFQFVLLVQAGFFSSSAQPASKTVRVRELAQDFQMPQSFIQMIESDLRLETKILTPVFNFIPLEVLLTEKSSQTLNSPSVLFQFPKGGGGLDFQKIIQGQGSFYLSFPPEQFTGSPDLEHLFYVSQAPKIKIGTEEFGLGCGKWLDLKNKFKDLQKNDFLSLNTTNLRHLFVTAGNYIFVFRKFNQIYLTQVTISDSKNENMLCPKTKGFL